MKKTLLAVTLTAAAAAATFSTQASAHDPIAGALIGGGIGAAVGGPPGAAVGAILGLAIGSDSHRYRDRRYYGERPDYYDPRYSERRYYDRAPARYVAPAYAEPPRVYRASPRYEYEQQRAYRDDRGYDRRYEPRYDDRRYQEDRRYEPQYRYDERSYDSAPRYYR